MENPHSEPGLSPGPQPDSSEDLGQLFLQFIDRYPEYPDIFINAYLVEDNVRKSFLLQSIDYRGLIQDISPNWETSLKQTAPRTLEFIQTLRELFPDLKMVPIDQGILILKETTPIPFDLKKYTNTQLGELLSYPCPGDISRQRNYAVHYRMIYKRKKYHLFGSICDELVPQTKILAQAIDDSLQRLNSFLPEEDQLRAIMIVDQIISVETVIQAILNDEVTDRIKKEARNFLSNDNYDLLNKLHNDGIIDMFSEEYKYLLVSLLIRYSVNNKRPTITSQITDLPEKRRVQKISFKKNGEYLLEVLRTLHGLQIDDKYITEINNSSE